VTDSGASVIIKKEGVENGINGIRGRTPNKALRYD
jgi:hypothetical protein